MRAAIEVCYWKDHAAFINQKAHLIRWVLTRESKWRYAEISLIINWVTSNTAGDITQGVLVDAYLMLIKAFNSQIIAKMINQMQSF